MWNGATSLIFSVVAGHEFVTQNVENYAIRSQLRPLRQSVPPRPRTLTGHLPGRKRCQES
jgi:hypothetical protein